MLLTTLMLTSLVSFNCAAPTFADLPAPSQVFAKSKSNSNDITSGAAVSNTYKQYFGDGSAPQGWPDMDQWVSFQAMFDANIILMKSACTDLFQLPPGSDTSDAEVNEIWNAIQTVAQETAVDHRFILAVMMQESGGCVRVYTTHNAVANPGLMQSHAGSYSCNQGAQGQTWGLVSPCPADQITGMIRDGVSGTTAGDGLVGLLNTAASMGGTGLDGSSAQLYYQAARAYNSGQFDPTNLDTKFSSSKCYTMDIANRLTGWTSAAKQCIEW